MLDAFTVNDLLVEHLRPEHVRVVYPLIRAADSTITLRDWMRYAKPLVARQKPRRGVLVARGKSQRHPSGAVCYRSDRRIGRGAVLTAEYFVAMTLVSPGPIVAALLAQLDDIAAGLGCGLIRFIVRDDRSPVLQMLRLGGPGVEGVTFSRPVQIGVRP